MKFSEIIDHSSALLQRKGRLTYRSLKLEFALDDEQLEALKEELIDGQRVARDEEGKVLVWVGGKPQAEPENQRIRESEQNPNPSSDDPRPWTLDARQNTAERRQLTVLFCDMVGFTELANRVDPEVLDEIVRRYEDTCAVCITRYEGYVYQRLGDGIVAFFGYPLAHEGEAERAVHAGLAIIAALTTLTVPEVEQLQVRIGIATGVVVVAGAEKGAVGETMNLASRLQGIAPVGSIVVSERVRRVAGGTFAYTDLGEQSLKGIAQPTRAYRVIGVSQAVSRFEAATQTGLTPLVGREHEIALLLERWQLAQEGDGQVVLVSGEPGIGKSRIVSALLEQLAADGVHLLRFQCSPYHVNSAFYPIIDNFERTLKFARDESLNAKLDKLEALIVDQYGCPRDDVRFLATLLSIPCEERYGALPLTPQKHKDETLRVLVDVTEAAARTQSTVLLFEDVHWADPTSLEVLDLLIERIRTLPLLVVLTHRPEFPTRWATHSQVTALNLSKLTRAQSSAIIAKLTGGKALPAELLGQMLAKTDGVPLYVEELTKTLLESGDLLDAGERYEYVGIKQTVTLPATLRDSLMARLDRVPAVKEIAQIGAAIGREFSYALLAAVASTPQLDPDSVLQQLTDSGLAFRRGTPPEATYTFKHALVQDAAYDSLLKSRRHELHGTIARVLAKDFPQTIATEPELLAHHLTAAGQAAAAIPYWQQAGTLALKRFALNEAIAHLNQGMVLIGMLPPSVERDGKELDLCIPLGTAWLARKGAQAPEVWTSLHAALGLAKSLSRRDALLPIYNGLAMNVLTQGRLTETLAWVADMLATAETISDPDLLLVAHRIACLSHFHRGDMPQSHTHGDQVLALYDEAKHRYIADLINLDPKTSTGVIVASGTWMLGYPDRAVQVLQTTDVHARRRGHPFDLGWMLTVGTMVWDLHREPEHALARVEEAERLGRTHSLPFISDVLAQVWKGVAWLRAGRLAEGIPQLRGAMETYHAQGGELRMPYYRAVLAEGLALSGDLAGGFQLIEESLTQIARPGWEERWWLAEVLRLKGELLLMQESKEHGARSQEQEAKLGTDPRSLIPDPQNEAEECFLKAIEVAREQQAKSWELRAVMSLVRLRQQQAREQRAASTKQGEGNRELGVRRKEQVARTKRAEAHRMLSEIYHWFTEGFDTKDLQEAKALLDEVSEGE